MSKSYSFAGLLLITSGPETRVISNIFDRASLLPALAFKRERNVLAAVPATTSPAGLALVVFGLSHTRSKSLGSVSWLMVTVKSVDMGTVTKIEKALWMTTDMGS